MSKVFQNKGLVKDICEGIQQDIYTPEEIINKLDSLDNKDIINDICVIKAKNADKDIDISILHELCHKDDKWDKVLEFVLDIPETDINIFVQHATPIAVCIQYGNIERINMFIKYGANLNVQNDYNGQGENNSRYSLLGFTLMHTHIRDNVKEEILNLLLDNKADINQPCIIDENGNNRMFVFEVAQQLSPDMILKSIEYSDIDIKSTCPSTGENLLHKCVSNTNYDLSDTIKMLLEDIDVNSVDIKGLSALHHASTVEYINLLVDNGAMMDLESGNDTYNASPLLYNIIQGDDKIDMVRSLLDKGVDVNKPMNMNDGSISPLEVSIARSNINITRELMLNKNVSLSKGWMNDVTVWPVAMMGMDNGHDQETKLEVLKTVYKNAPKWRILKTFCITFPYSILKLIFLKLYNWFFSR